MAGFDWGNGDFDWDEVGVLEEGAGSQGSPSPEDIAAGLDQGLVIFSKVFGVVVSVVGGIATLADGRQVPVAELGVTTAGGEELPPESWIEGVPNVAVLGIGAVLLIVLLKSL